SAALSGASGRQSTLQVRASEMATSRSSVDLVKKAAGLDLVEQRVVDHGCRRKGRCIGDFGHHGVELRSDTFNCWVGNVSEPVANEDIIGFLERGSVCDKIQIEETCQGGDGTLFVRFHQGDRLSD